MKKDKVVRTKLIKNMVVNLVLFTVIFSIFSLFIWVQVNNYLYNSADEELYQYKKQLEELSKYVTITESKIFPETTDANDELIEGVQNNIDKIANPRVETILRDSAGKVLATSLKVKSYADYLNNTDFSEDTVDKIYEISINYKYF